MKLQTEIDVVDDFIQQFRQFGTDVVDCFSYGMCFHFSLILCARFKYDARRVYDPVANHFAVEIFGRIWDISGDITDKDYKWEYWDTYCMKDQKETRRIIRDCVRKLPSQLTTCEFCINNEEDDWGNLFCKLTKESVRPDHSCEQGERET